MDWDGIGTAAFFIGSGGVGVSLIFLRAYKAQLASKLESERLRHGSPQTDETQEQIRYLETQVQRLTERVDFAEGLLGKGHSDPPAADKVD